MSIYVWCVFFFPHFFLMNKKKTHTTHTPHTPHTPHTHTPLQEETISHFLQSIKQTLLNEHHKAYMWENFEI